MIWFNVHLVPINNVATLESSAVVSEGVSRVRNALINGDYHSYDWDSGKMSKITNLKIEKKISNQIIRIFRLYLSSIGFRWYCDTTISTLCC